MKFIQTFGYTVKVGQEEAHQKWVTENDERLRKAAAAGSTYIGTFIAVFSSQKHVGGYRVLMELDSYGAMDAGAATMKDAKSDWKLLSEQSRFIDTAWNVPWSNELLTVEEARAAMADLRAAISGRA